MKYGSVLLPGSHQVRRYTACFYRVRINLSSGKLFSTGLAEALHFVLSGLKIAEPFMTLKMRFAPCWQIWNMCCLFSTFSIHTLKTIFWWQIWHLDGIFQTFCGDSSFKKLLFVLMFGSRRISIERLISPAWRSVLLLNRYSNIYCSLAHLG